MPTESAPPSGQRDDRVERLGVERRPADEPAVAVGQREQLVRVVGLHRAAVDDPHPLGRLLGAVADQRAAEAERILGLLGRRDLAGPDRPDRLVGDHDVAEALVGDLAQVLLDLVAQVSLGVARLALVLGLTHAEDRDEPGVERRLHLLRQRTVGLAEVLAPLGVPEHDAVDPELDEHRGRDLAGERALLGLVHVLGVHADPVRRLAGRGQRGERHAHGHVDALARRDRGGELARARPRAVHLPVAGDEGRARHASASTPGSVRPSMSSSDAPPPVETWSTSSSSPNFAIAAPLSPPPTTVVPSVRATASATARVPAANGSSSKAPIGPFQNTVPAPAIASAYALAVRGPTSRPIHPSGTSTPSSSCVSVPSENSRPRTRSTGSSSLSSPSTLRAGSMPSDSHSEAPTECPCAAKNGKHIAPPISTLSATSRKRSTTPILSVTLAPPTTATSGRRGPASSRVSVSTSRCSSSPAALCDTKCVMPSVDACARCAAPNASST